jgi:Tol biopolymer transport system component
VLQRAASDHRFAVCGPHRDVDPSLSDDGKQLAFASDRDGDWELYLLTDRGCRYPELDDSEVRRLTDNEASDRQPALSPNASSVAFASDRGGESQIYVMRLDGRDVRQVTFGKASVAPSWSPDGSRLAYQAGTPGDMQIFVSELDGANPTRLTSVDGDEYDPAWSDDGSRLAYVSDRDGNPEVYVVDIASGEEVRMTNSPYAEAEPAWCSSDLCFAAVRESGWAIYRIPEGEQTAVLAIGGPGDQSSPSFGPKYGFPNYDR